MQRLLSNLVGDEEGGLPMLDLMPSTSLAEAKKDPHGSRGKVLKVSGNVIEIHRAKNGDIFEGAIMTSGMSVVRFVTSLSTEGVFDGTWASFRGVFVQEYAYPNVSGGQTRSLLVVGAFDIPQNRRR